MKPTILATILLVLAAAAPRPAAAIVPATLSYQGVLTDNVGALVPDGPYDLTFRIWNVDVGGGPANLLYCETQAALHVFRGGFSAIIGDGTLCVGSPTLASLPFDTQYWLEIQVGVDPPLAPRVKLTSSPHALMAKTVLDNAIDGSKVLDNSLTAADIAPNIVSSISGVSNDGGDVDVVAGNGMGIGASDATNTITISQLPPRYYLANHLNSASLNATSAFAKIDDYITFNKITAGSIVEVRYDARAFSGTFAGGASAMYYELRIDDNPSTLAGQGAITLSGSTQFISMMAVFFGLPAGPHTVSVWGRTNLGTSTGVLLDPGGFLGAIIAKETY